MIYLTISILQTYIRSSKNCGLRKPQVGTYQAGPWLGEKNLWRSSSNVVFKVRKDRRSAATIEGFIDLKWISLDWNSDDVCSYEGKIWRRHIGWWTRYTPCWSEWLTSCWVELAFWISLSSLTKESKTELQSDIAEKKSFALNF